MEKDKGTALTHHHFLSLTVHGSEVKALKDFRQRFNYIYEALEVADRPTEASIRSLLFQQLKGHPKLALHIDRYRNASVGSSKHTWRWLYNKMCEVIEISQLEENADAIDKALKPKSANPAPKSEKQERKRGKRRRLQRNRKKRKSKTSKRRQRKKQKQGKPRRRRRNRKPPQLQHHRPAQRAKARVEALVMAMALPRARVQKRKTPQFHACFGRRIVATKEETVSICVIGTSCTRALNRRTLSLQEQVQTQS